MEQISAQMAGDMVHDGAPIALLDVREAGQFGEGHALFAVPAPYSQLELIIGDLVPRLAERIVLMDDDDGVAERAAKRLSDLGYTNIHRVEGGVGAWGRAGLCLYKGVNVPMKTLGELAEHVWHPQFLSPEGLKQWKEEEREFGFFDSRPPAEYAKMRVPGAVCLPNGELAHRITAVDPAEQLPIVITCAGRTRGIIGAIGLKLSGYAGPILALENGTQGWALSGEMLERDNAVSPFPELTAHDLHQSRERADKLMARFAIPEIDGEMAAAMLRDSGTSTYFFDTRSASEVENDPVPGAAHVPGVQLVQSVDQWVGTRHARLILCCDTGLRSTITAFWLRQVGFDVHVLRVNEASKSILEGIALRIRPPLTHLAEISADEALRQQKAGALLLDIRGSMEYRKGHVKGAHWAIRPRLASALAGHQNSAIILIGDRSAAALVAQDLRDLGVADLCRVEGGQAALVAAGATMTASQDSPEDAACIDHLFFVHDRHDGNMEASRRYLAWETGLIEQLSVRERAEFKLGRGDDLIHNSKSLKN